MGDDVRLVPMSHADVSWLHTSADTPQRTEALMRLNIGFNRAPADPAGVIRGTLPMAVFGEARGPCAIAILAALGVPANPANEEHHA